MMQAVLPLVRLSILFWKGPRAHFAWALSLGSVVFAVGDVAFQYLLNLWNRHFYDALEQRSAPLLEAAVWSFAILVLAATAVVMAGTLCKLLLQVALRQHLTTEAIKAWLGDQAFYRLNILHGTSFGPEYRIAEDVRLTIEPVADLLIGAFTALAMTIAFASVLWVVGGATTIAGVAIPGFMVYLAIVYSVGLTAMMSVFGSNYAQRIRNRSEAEARFRYELTRVRENAESVALLRGEPGERQNIGRHLSHLVATWNAYAFTWTKMTWVTYTSGLVAPVLPLLIMMPKYLSGEATLGVVMQTATAFGVFQSSLSWFTSNYARLSEWVAAASRVSELLEFIQLAGDGDEAVPRIAVVVGDDEKLRLTGLSVRLHDGATLIADTDLVVGPGEMVLVNGESGAGKSTLVRAIAGLWPWGTGQVALPKSATIAFLPQRSYIPNGPLRDALTYPEPSARVPDERIVQALELTGLGNLASALDLDQSWDKFLSGGEQQRLAFARLLIHRPSLVFLDEATSALDAQNEARMMDLFTNYLFATTVISVAHRPSLAAYHNRSLLVRRREAGSSVESSGWTPTVQHAIRRALQDLRGTTKPR